MVISYRHHLKRAAPSHLLLEHPERFELPSNWFVAKRSIPLSYGCMVAAEGFAPSAEKLMRLLPSSALQRYMVVIVGLEPTTFTV